MLYIGDPDLFCNPGDRDRGLDQHHFSSLDPQMNEVFDGRESCIAVEFPRQIILADPGKA